jgi:hypothetical protein
MLTIREEVQAFVRAADLLLSPIMMGRPLHEYERDTVCISTQNLAERFSGVESYAEESLQSEKEAILHRSHQLTIETRAVIERTRMEMQAARAAVAQMRERINGSRKACGRLVSMTRE